MKKVGIICDFDGTVSARDIGHHFFGTFVPDRERWLDLLDEWRKGLISSKECLEREVEWVEADREDLDNFISRETLDPYFKDFVDFCDRRHFELLITSDGLDYYIDWLLMRFGIGYLTFYANRLVFSDCSFSGIQFPYYNRMECTRCGNCKRYHLENMKGQGYFTVYVGNGYSDRCPSEHANMVFAKGELLEYCREQRIAHIPFSNFREIERELTTRFILAV